jgi:4-alpha-glucanotransferase
MALFNWLKERSAGLLLHPTCLPGETGIGTMGEYARKWIDFLAASGAKYWQVLPLCPTGFGDSPYQSFSVFAGNPYLIDLEELVNAGLLKEEELDVFRALGDTKVDYGAQYALRFPILMKAFDRFKRWQGGAWREYGDFAAFQRENLQWLKPYALFMALKAKNNGKSLHDWPDDERVYAKAVGKASQPDVAHLVEAYEFWQYLFFGQWERLRKYAASHGVKIIGDAPIYVSPDGADLWCNPGLFLLDNAGSPTHVGGCPPDYFGPQGQMWGNPIYDWGTMRDLRYAWWIMRLRQSFRIYDVVRLDHFRGFYDYWKIPAGRPDGRVGEWCLGPAMELFKAIHEQIPDAQIIAEDLGDLNDGVRDFLKETGLPGMSILQFAFGGDSKNAYLPHNGISNQVVYSGTHDNDTLAGWIGSVPDHVRAHALEYLGCQKGVFVEEAVKAVFASVARLAIVPAQDLLGLGAQARINTPGTNQGNWDWRLTEAEFERLDSRRLRKTLAMYGRA